MKKLKKLKMNKHGELVVHSFEDFVIAWNSDFINKFYSKHGMKESKRGYE